MELGRNQAEVALTKKLAATLVQQEVMEPLAAMGWKHGTPPSPEQTALMLAERGRQDGATEEQIAAFLAERGVKYTPPAGGQPARTEGAPAPAATPVAPVQSGQPASAPAAAAPAAPVAKTDAPASTDEAAKNVLALFESLKGSDGKYMGKYNSLDEALKGAGHLANMAKSALQRAEAAEARLSAAPAASPVAAPPAAVPAAAPALKPFVPTSRPSLEAARARLDKVLSKTGDGFDGDSAREFAEATREVAREEALAVAAEERERQEHADRTASERNAAVNAYMAEKFPESQNLNDDEFSLFLRTNPLLTEAMLALRAQGREQRAAELGYTEFVKARGGVPGSPGITRAEAERREVVLDAREQVRKEARDEALKDAGIVHGSAGGSSAVETPGVTGPSQDEINAMAERMRREGEAPGSAAAMQWRRMTIGRFLPPELFGQQ